MSLTELMLATLPVAAGLFGEAATTEVGKSAGKTIYDAIKTRLATSFGITDSVPDQEALEKAGVEGDADLARLVAELADKITAMPAEQTAPYALEVEIIKVKRDILISNPGGGVKIGTAESTDGGFTFKQDTQPGKA